MYLATLPLQSEVVTALDTRTVLVHASPRDPLFEDVPTASPDQMWREALSPAGAAAFVFVGHTHDQFIRRIDCTTLVNPGSVGMPKDGDPRASYAIVDAGRIELCRTAYDTERAAARIEALPLAPEHRRRLTHVIRRARLP